MESKIKELYELCETISKAIAEANEKIRSAGGKLTAGDVDYVDKLTHALKSTKATMAMMEEEGEEGNSGYYPGMGGVAYRGGNSNRSYRGGSYREGGSYARGQSNARQSRRGGYSGEDGYSRHGDLTEELYELMNEAPDERTRREFERFISKLESM